MTDELGIRKKHKKALKAFFAAKDPTAELFSDAASLINALLKDAEDVEEQLAEAERTAAEVMTEEQQEIELLTECLTHVKYWMLDTLVHHRPMTDPRAVLRRIEECLR